MSKHFGRFPVPRETLVCLTTLRHRRFLEDVVHSVSMPKGSRLRLRYRQQYVSDEVWQRAERSTLCGTWVVFAVGATDSSGVSDVAPLREARVLSARLESSIIVLDLCLGDHVKASGATTEFKTEFMSTEKGMPTSFDGSSSAGFYVQLFPGPVQSVVPQEGVASWEDACRRVFALDDLSRSGAGTPAIPFLYWIGGLSKRMTRDLQRLGSIEVEAGSRFDFEVQTFSRSDYGLIRDPLGEVKLDLSHSATQLTTSSSVRIDSQRDIKNVSISTTSLFRRVIGHVSFRMVCFHYPEGPSERSVLSAKDTRTEVVLSRYDFPLAVGAWRPILASALVATAAGVVSFEMPEKGEGWFEALLTPLLVFLFAFAGLRLGLRKDS